MTPNFIFDETQFPEFDLSEGYKELHDHFPALEIENLVADEELPSLEDVNHSINDYCNQFGEQMVHIQIQDPENVNHPPYWIPGLEESINENPNPNPNPNQNSNLNSKSILKSKPTNMELNSPASLELLSNYQSKFKRLRENSVVEPPPESDGQLSTVEIIELAAEKFIKFSSQRVNGYTMFTHPYGSSAFTSLSVDEIREVELVFQLLTAAEKVGLKQYDTACKFLTRCRWVACVDGSPVERVVYYLCEALQKRIGKEIVNAVAKKPERPGLEKADPNGMGTNFTFFKCYQALPFIQLMQFTGIQAIIDQIGKSTKIHLVDVHIRSGVQWTALIQALEERKSQIKLLKLTAFATSSDVQQVSETGKRLESFATTLSLPFVFKILVLSDITEVHEEQFEVQDGEVVAVYCQTILRTMISRPRNLENLMRTIQTIKPVIVVVAEVEANHNSTSFVNRFTETLFFYGAFFDCLDVCMSRDDTQRAITEGVHFAVGMENIVANEGAERMIRSVNIKTWRSFFSKFGMVEIALSEPCLYQANLVLQRFSCASSCTLTNDNKCLIIGWKGTPLHSLSTWKFIQE